MSRWWLVAAVCGVGAACGGASESAAPQAADAVRVASFEFEESQLIAELYAQVLEEAGLAVVRIGAIGPREVVAPALEQGLVDLVPEYLGSASSHFEAATPDLAGLTAALAPRGLVPLEPAGALDVNVVVVTATSAAKIGLATISDLVPVAGDLSLGGPVECPDRPFCLVGLRDVYGLEFAEFVPQRSLAVTAEALRRSEIDVGVMFSTAPELSDAGFVVLADDRILQPADQVLPVVRAATIDDWGSALVDALAELSRALTTDALRALNREVRDGAPIEAAVAAWLRSANVGHD